MPYIRDILRHVELATTDIYARASTEAKRKALEAAYTDIVTHAWPNGTSTRAAQLARQPVSLRTRKGYAQCSAPNAAVTRASRPALRITQHCS